MSYRKTTLPVLANREYAICKYCKYRVLELGMKPDLWVCEVPKDTFRVSPVTGQRIKDRLRDYCDIKNGSVDGTSSRAGKCRDFKPSLATRLLRLVGLRKSLKLTKVEE